MDGGDTEELIGLRTEKAVGEFLQGLQVLYALVRRAYQPVRPHVSIDPPEPVRPVGDGRNQGS